MDLTIKMNDGYFNYRVAAVIIHNNKLLVMYNQETDTYYLLNYTRVRKLR